MCRSDRDRRDGYYGYARCRGHTVRRSAGSDRRTVACVRRRRRFDQVLPSRADQQGQRGRSADRLEPAGGRSIHRRPGAQRPSPLPHRDTPHGRRRALQPQWRGTGGGVRPGYGRDALDSGAGGRGTRGLSGGDLDPRGGVLDRRHGRANPGATPTISVRPRRADRPAVHRFRRRRPGRSDHGAPGGRDLPLGRRTHGGA